MALLAACAIIVACVLAYAEEIDGVEKEAVRVRRPAAPLEAERRANAKTLAAWEAMRPSPLVSGTDEECEARR